MPTLNRRSLAIIFLPLILAGSPILAEPPASYVCTFPTGIAPNFNNPQMLVDTTGKLFCATRGDSSVGGLVWVMDNYVDAEHPGIPRIVLNGPPADFFALGELQVFSDGRLYYTTIQVDNLTDRRAQRMISFLVPEWTP